MKLNKFMFICFIGTLLMAISLQAQTTLPTPSKYDCSFYPKLESILKCSNETKYLSDYGYPYCKKFQGLTNEWTGALKKWVPDTTYCLQSELVRDRSNLSPCKLMEDTAFGSHPTCYMKTGFCKFTYSDKQRIMNVVAFKDVVSSFSQSVAQLLRVKSTCDMGVFDGLFHFLDYIRFITSTMDVATKTLAGEILLNTPTEDEAVMNAYYSQMLYILQTGDETLDKDAYASYKQMGKKDVPPATESSFEKCKVTGTETAFCLKFKASNTVAFSKATNSKDFALALTNEDIRARVVKANKLSKRWKKSTKK